MNKLINSILSRKNRKKKEKKSPMNPEEKALHVKSFEKDLERAKVF